MAYDNIEKLGALFSDGRVSVLQKNIAASERKISELIKKIEVLEAAAEAKRAEEARLREEEERRLAEEEKKRREQAEAEEKAKAKEEAEKQAAAKQEKPATEKPAEPKPAEKTKPAEKSAPQKTESAEKPAEKKPAEKPAPVSREKAPERPAAAEALKRPQSAVSGSTRPASGASGQGARPTFRPERTDRPRPSYGGASTARPAGGANGQGMRSTYRPQQGTGARPAYGAGQRPMSPRPLAPRPAPVPPPQPRREAPKKFERTYVEQRHPVNKRALQRQQGMTVGDFDEDKSGYRKARFGKKTRKEVQTVKIDHAVVTSKDIPIKVLSEKLGISAVEITKRLFKEGVMKTVNESVDYDNAAFIALELGIDLEYKPEKTAEDALFEEHGDAASDGEALVPRAPVVTVMGHVDHGKTSLLDRIRKTNVTDGEAGGITQSIGAYTVTVGDSKNITFIDTPGHAAFSAMRARGAKITDIVVLVVAADDGVMPQTVEAIDHALAANVPIIVAMNKIDKPQIDPDRVKNGLNEHGLLPEEWGGDVIIVPVSAKTGEGIDKLLETILLVAEMDELKADPTRRAKGVIIEAKLDKGKGPMASVLVQNGTLHTGDNLISGTTMGRVRAMFDDKGQPVKEAGPSTPVSVLGLEDVPNAGDAIFAVEQSLMKQVQEERKNKQRESMIQETKKRTLDELFTGDGDLKELKIVVKGDVQGSVEAVKSSLEKLSNEEVAVKVIHAGAGAINESDITLADSAKAIVVGFNVRPDSKARTLAERSKVDVRTYRIIYEMLDEMEAMLKGMVSPKYRDVYLGKAEVRETFNITGVGVVAGCLVTEGRLVRGCKLRIYRNDVMIVEGNVKQLKHYKDDVKEAAAGTECGCAIENFNEIKIGDFIECYQVEEVKS